MDSSRIPSPARLQGMKSTPRRYKPRTRSVGSPARSNTSVKLSAMIQMDTFPLSPMPSRRSVLTDTTDIDIPQRRSWWKKLDENSREIMEVASHKEPGVVNNAIEEYIEVDVLSQEKKSYTLDLPESSDGDSINSIVIPQRKLFTQKESIPQRKFGQIIDNREALAKLNKTQGDDEKTLTVGRKTLFNKGMKQRTKPLFPSALINISPNKTKDLPAPTATGQVKSLFGNLGSTKRKNMFADFIVSESEDEIPEIQPKMFRFKKIAEQKRRQSVKSCDVRNPSITSPASSIPDIEIDDWRLLPSSTLVDHQLEDGLRNSPSKRARLSKISDAIESTNTESNTTANKTKVSNKSLHSKSKFKIISESKDLDASSTHKVVDIQSDKINTPATKIHKNVSYAETSGMEVTKNKNNNNFQNTSKVSLNKTNNSIPCEGYNDLDDKNLRSYEKNKNNTNKTSRIDQVLQSEDDEENISLVYENDDAEEIQNEPSVFDIALNHSKNKSKSRSALLQNEMSNNYDLNYTGDVTDPKENFNIDEQAVTVDNNNKKECLLEKSVTKNYSHVNKTKEQQNSLLSSKLEEVQEHLTHCSDQNISQKLKDMEVIQRINTNVSQELKANIEKETGEEEEREVQIRNKKEYALVSDFNDQGIDYQKDKEVQDNYDDIELEEEIRNEGEACNDNQRSEAQIQNKEIEDALNFQERPTHLIDSVDTKTGPSPDRTRQKHELKIPSPEVILHNKISQIESFTMESRNTSIRKTKSNIKNHTIRPSLAPVRESTGFSDGSRNSSMDGSGWDSHRTTRATLRQTFGKDFTPRKSLRALVMEKSAKRQNRLTETDVNISRSPQANSTELPIPELFNLDDTGLKMVESNQGLARRSGVKQKRSHAGNNANNMEKITNEEGDSCMTQNINESNNKITHDNNISLNEQKIVESDHELPCNIDEAQEIIESNNAQDISDSNKEISKNNSAQNSQEENKSVDIEETNESEDELFHDADNTQETNQSNAVHQMNESDAGEEINESDHEMSADVKHVQETNESDHEMSANVEDIQETNESDHEMSADVEDGQETNESDHEMSANVEDIQETNESDHEMSADIEDGQETNESDHEMSPNVEDIQETNKSDHEMSADVEDGQETNESDHDISADVNDVQEFNESNHEQSADFDVSPEINASTNEETNDIDDVQEINESDDAQEINEAQSEVSDNDESGEKCVTDDSNNEQEVDESKTAQDTNNSGHESFQDADETDEQILLSNLDNSKKTRQTTLEMYLQRVKKQNIERKKQLEDEIRNSLKVPTRDMLNPFKIPAIPKPHRMKTQQIKPKTKPLKSASIPLNMLPAEILEDMKYKPPKRYRPTNASWITKRLYKFLETKLEPKYDYKARVRSEKLVETIYNFTKDIRRHDTAPAEAINALKREMARMDVVKTHFEFYDFFHEYMPREVRLKVVPDVFNKLSLPKHGVFSDILR